MSLKLCLIVLFNCQLFVFQNFLSYHHLLIELSPFSIKHSLLLQFLFFLMFLCTFGSLIKFLINWLCMANFYSKIFLEKVLTHLQLLFSLFEHWSDLLLSLLFPHCLVVQHYLSLLPLLIIFHFHQLNPLCIEKCQFFDTLLSFLLLLFLQFLPFLLLSNLHLFDMFILLQSTFCRFCNKFFMSVHLLFDVLYVLDVPSLELLNCRFVLFLKLLLHQQLICKPIVSVLHLVYMLHILVSQG